MVLVRRVYNEPSPNGGLRVLVDRVWPRGVAKDWIDHWMPDIAPSTELRKWFGHDPARFDEFRRRYWDELKGKREMLDELKAHLRKGPITLLYAAKETRYSNAVVLRELLDESV